MGAAEKQVTGSPNRKDMITSESELYLQLHQGVHIQKRNRKQAFQQIFVSLFTVYKSSTVAGRWQQPECLSVAEWINQMFGVEYYSALKRRFWFMLPRGEPCGQPN